MSTETNKPLPDCEVCGKQIETLDVHDRSRLRFKQAMCRSCLAQTKRAWDNKTPWNGPKPPEIGGSLDRAQVLRLVFGSSARFEVAAWLVGRKSDTFIAGNFAEETGYFLPTFTKVIEGLERLGMVQRAPGSGSVMTWRRLPSPLWDLYKEGVRIFGTVQERQVDDLRSNLEALSARLAEE